MALSRFTAVARINRPPSASAVANTNDSKGCRRPSGTGRSRVRRMRLSVWRSMTWLNADAPPATSAVPATVHTTTTASDRSPPAITYPANADATTSKLRRGFASATKSLARLRAAVNASALSFTRAPHANSRVRGSQLAGSRVRDSRVRGSQFADSLVRGLPFPDSHWKLETGNWKLETGSWELKAGSSKLECAAS